MKLYDPNTSRMLALLIQPIADEDRTRFVADAEKAPDLRAFLAKYPNYKKYNK